MDCNTILDLRGQKLPIIINDTDTLSFSLVFKDDAGVARDMSAATITLTVNDVIVASSGSGITVGGVDSNEVTVVYVHTEGIGVHNYSLNVTESGATKAEIYGTLTIKDA
jgi:hypothetical protein